MVVKILPIPSTKLPQKSLSLSTKRSQLSRSVPSLPTLQSDLHPLPNAADLRQMCIITKSDLNRIYDNLERRQRDKDAIRQELQRKNEMAERSAQMTKHWPNTILGARQRKLEAKRIREEEEEERRKVLDIEEEKLAAERRRQQIEKAKQLQYYETDRIRTFHSAMLLTEVLKERDLQIEMKKRIEQMRQNNEADVLKRYEEAQIEFQKAEKEKMEQKIRDRADLAKYHLAQMDRIRAKTIEEKQKDRQEGAEYRRLAEQNTLEHYELERFRKLNQKEVRKMYDKTIEDRRKVKQIEQELDEEEDEDLRLYAEAKKKMARLRREKELQVAQEKQDARDYMIGYLGSLQKRTEADNETQMIRARNQKEAKERREEQEKYEKTQKMLETINKHRQETIKRHEAEKEMEEREDAEMRRKKQESDNLYSLYQQEKDRQRLENAQHISQAHLKQAQEHKDRQRELKANELEEIQIDKHLNAVEKQQYQDYTGRVISFMDGNGRNTYPMKRTVADELKRFDEYNHGYQPNETSINTNSEKNPGNPNLVSLDETKKHLGFHWNSPKK